MPCDSHQPLTDQDLDAMECRARAYTRAYTGTSGTLAADVMRLLGERQRLIVALAMLRERGAVACEPTNPTLTNEERAAVEAILSDPDLVLGDTREPLRCLLERLSHHSPDAGNMVKNTVETRKNRGMP